MANHILSSSKLKSLLHYDPETGVFTRLVRTSNRIKVGQVAGGLNGGGYIQIRIDGVLQQAHRLAWLYMVGEWPNHEVDHKNAVTFDNRWENLRDVPHKENCQNQRASHTNSKIGILGVSKNTKGFKSSIKKDGERIHLGTFKTPELAHEAYLVAKRELHSSCTI
jgi:hypothetical protein